MFGKSVEQMVSEALAEPVPEQGVGGFENFQLLKFGGEIVLVGSDFWADSAEQ